MCGGQIFDQLFCSRNSSFILRVASSSRKLLFMCRKPEADSKGWILNECVSWRESKSAQRAFVDGMFYDFSSKRNLRETIRRMGVYEYKRKVNERTKVLVADDEGTLTPNLLRALVLGVKIVREEWVRLMLLIGLVEGATFSVDIVK